MENVFERGEGGCYACKWVGYDLREGVMGLGGRLQGLEEEGKGGFMKEVETLMEEGCDLRGRRQRVIVVRMRDRVKEKARLLSL